MEVVWILIALGALLLGIGIGYWLHACSPEVCKAKEDLEQLQVEYEDYRNRVDQHFNRSAELFQEMTLSYKAVYDHLAGGVQDLCGATGQHTLGKGAGVQRFPEFGDTEQPPPPPADRQRKNAPPPVASAPEDADTEWEANGAATPTDAQSGSTTEHAPGDEQREAHQSGVAAGRPDRPGKPPPA